MTSPAHQTCAPLTEPANRDDLLSYYACIDPQNLTTWAVTAMRNSYSPYSGRKEGVLIRTEQGDIMTGTNVETINWDGLTAIEVAIGRLFARQPWVDPQNRPERISDIIYALEDFDPRDPDSYVPSGRSLDWLRRFGSPDTVLHFTTAAKKILVSKTLNDLLPHGPKMKALKSYFDMTAGFSHYLRDHQGKPAEIEDGTWHRLRRARLHAFAPYSGFRVGVTIEAEDGVSGPLAEEAISRLRAQCESDEIHPDMVGKIVARFVAGRQYFEGINVELSGNEALHAEACAIGAMITEMGPGAKLRRVHLQGGFDRAIEGCTSCGKCRQLINEFSTAATEVITISEDAVLRAMNRDHLLPGTFAKLG